MAGGKQTPRQKMVNLMYLVFIAMMALNMSKEVLTAFGLMNEQFESSNSEAVKNNKMSYDQLVTKAGEDSHFVEAKNIAEKVQGISAKFSGFLEGLKSDVTKDIEKTEKGKLPYEAMDKGDKIDELWFNGDGYSKRGQEIVDAINKYKTDMKAAVGADKKYQSIISDLDNKFNTDDVVDREGVKKKFLDYHYKGFPAIASLTKLSALQNSVEVVEANVYASALGKAAVDASSMKNYTALVVLDKNAYFQGEKVTGKVVLGKYDENTKPTSFQGPGKIENGQAVINMTAGAVGEQSIKGKFTFLEDGKEIPLAFESKYVVVPRPNSATISADKMNVVYRGVANPISVSFAGIAADKVSASAPGMSSAGKAGNYVLNPGGGNTVMVNVTGTLPNGDKVSDKKEFRIKGLPAPTGKVRGEVAAKGPKSNLEVVTITATMEDFDFPVTVNVTQFNVKVPGQPTIVVSGNKMDGRAKSAIAKAQKGDVVVISEIKASFTGIDQRAKAVSACTFEVQ
ncbi:gliding motility protein GldM [Flavobacterium rivuli WB 3.3-2 = DSM 21788]|uniref:Gliding motility protein GldM n=1 Tax=Flavobacterium rivuli WB 3.3-2 = DSM 21788 TaxID=1121895 RepID=A0A0A2MCJ9_9FLAO|nr:gliding motility protein GldM [Flavobacterium rivuli]KGO86010.1 gliding motility protein GldM [Flavobacterium rivuli WB 3.3-2 = DSM 21788]